MNHAYARGALLRSSSATRLILLRRFEAESIINLDSYPKGHKSVDREDKEKDNFPKLGNLARYLPHTLPIIGEYLNGLKNTR